MIKVDSITIYEFRGIKELTLDLDQNNYAICGPNGTGKSGIVDALEFVLTGSISRLTGEGRGEVSVKQHGPHVDKRDDPQQSKVSAKIFIPSLNKSAEIERNLKTPSEVEISPNEDDIKEVLDSVRSHPEIVLSRRELIKYVLATPGNRAAEVQELLRLDKVQQARAIFQKIANSKEKEFKQSEQFLKETRVKLLQSFGLTDLDAAKILAITNTHRVILGLEQISELTSTTSLKDGMATLGSQSQRIPKATALDELKEVQELLADISNEESTVAVSDLISELSKLNEDAALLESTKRESFYKLGLDLIQAEFCPLCDDNWNQDELISKVNQKVQHLKDVSKKRESLQNKIEPLQARIRNLQILLRKLVEYGQAIKPPLDVSIIQNHVKLLGLSIAQLQKFLPIEDTVVSLQDVFMVNDEVSKAVTNFEKFVQGLPEPSKQDAARDWLTIAQERLESYRETKRKTITSKANADVSRTIFDTYATVSDSMLQGIYKSVEKEFAKFYEFINRDDESGFTAKLIPSMGKLGFDVDFYGRGYFPPGAYHSEGHQDGMGLCLYLALMSHLQKKQFTFAVLDDVLMSVDSGHRREVCALLKQEFPNTQFVMTTHDPIWLRHMVTEKLVATKSSVQFRGWNVDHGPTFWYGRDIWAEIDKHLQGNDVRAASALLRHYLEYISAELCHRLNALIGFRGDARYQLGELMPAATGKMNSLYKKSLEAANSWNQKEIIQVRKEEATKFTDLVSASNVEQWQINAAVHFNTWENLQPKEFKPVVETFKKLLECFTCPECTEYVHLSPSTDSPESLRCNCGKVNFNLKKRG